MGYYTLYNLEVFDAGLNPCYDGIDHEEAISKSTKCYDNCFDDDEIKWYDHDKHMLKYSMQYPDLVFGLSGEGEENGDLWKKYYKNGKMQACKARIVYDEYDKSKLE